MDKFEKAHEEQSDQHGQLIDHLIEARLLHAQVSLNTLGKIDLDLSTGFPSWLNLVRAVIDLHPTTMD